MNSVLPRTPTETTHTAAPGTASAPVSPRGFLIRPCGCQSWLCLGCRGRNAAKLRKRLIPALETYTCVTMVTLTVDPTLFASPQQAFDYVRDRRCVSKAVKALPDLGHTHSRRFFYMTEWNAAGHAHYHVLLDATHVPASAVNMAWSSHRPAWAAPIVDGRPGFGFASVNSSSVPVQEAARSAAAYVVKRPTHPYPQWLMEMTRVRVYGASQHFWTANRRTRPRQKRKPLGPRNRPAKTYTERVAGCGVTANVFLRTDSVDPETGEVVPRDRWLAEIAPEAPAQIAGIEHSVPPAVSVTGPEAPSPSLEAAIEAAESERGQRMRIVRVRTARKATR